MAASIILITAGAIFCLFGYALYRLWAAFTGLVIGLGAGLALGQFLGAEIWPVVAGTALGVALAGVFYYFQTAGAVMARRGGGLCPGDPDPVHGRQQQLAAGAAGGGIRRRVRRLFLPNLHRRRNRGGRRRRPGAGALRPIRRCGPICLRFHRAPRHRGRGGDAAGGGCGHRGHRQLHPNPFAAPAAATLAIPPAAPLPVRFPRTKSGDGHTMVRDRKMFGKDRLSPD